MLKALAVTTATWMIVSGSSTASAGQHPCQDRSKVLEKLARDYKETTIAIGMAANGGVLEVLTTEDGADTRTFTIIVTMPDGKSCLLATGENFEVFEDPEMVAAQNNDPV